MELMRRLSIVVLLVIALSSCGGDKAQESDPMGSIPLSGAYVTSIAAAEFRGEPAAPPDVLKGEWSLYLGNEFRLEQANFGRNSGRLKVLDNRLTFFDTPAPLGTFNCFVDGKRTTEMGTGVYEYTLDGTELTLTPIDEPCPLREILLARTWERL